jgi:hypothetical protein
LSFRENYTGKESFRLAVVVFLSFMLGLGTTLEVAHDHNDHSGDFLSATHYDHAVHHEHAEHHDHGDDSQHSKNSEHYGFSAEQCSYTVLQNSSPSVAPDNLAIDFAALVSNELVVISHSFYSAPRAAFLARAPPKISRLSV